jgi:hypothetical protein
MVPWRGGANAIRGLGGGSSSENKVEGNSDVAPGLRGAPAVRERISDSLILAKFSDKGTIAVSLLRSIYGPGKKVGDIALAGLYARAFGNGKSLVVA